MKDPHTIIIKPYITERTAALSYGDARIQKDEDIQRKYTFIVATDANKIEIKRAFETIYNAGRKKDDFLEVVSVRTVNMKGAVKRVRTKARQYPVEGREATRKKAIITLKKGQLLEEYGV